MTLHRGACADDLCADCGHPRHLHVRCSDAYPSLCTHVELHDADAQEPADVCPCLEFSDDPTPIYGPLLFR